RFFGKISSEGPTQRSGTRRVDRGARAQRSPEPITSGGAQVDDRNNLGKGMRGIFETAVGELSRRSGKRLAAARLDAPEWIDGRRFRFGSSGFKQLREHFGFIGPVFQDFAHFRRG